MLCKLVITDFFIVFSALLYTYWVKVMRKLIFAVILIIISATVYATPSINGKAYVVADAITGRIIYSKNMNQRLPMASTTKLMTALIFLENADFSKPVIYTKEAKITPYHNLNFAPNTTLSANDALHSLLLPSSNDMATAIAISSGGTINHFLDMMNDKAKILGMNNTHYENVHGLDTYGHYSACYDISVLARELWKITYFRTIPKPEYKITYNENGITKEKLLTATYKEMFKFDGFKGIKTGTTTKAGKCFIGYFERNQNPLITVVLGSKNAMDDTKTLVNYTYQNCELRTIVSKNDILKLIINNIEYKLFVNKDIKLFADKESVFNIKIAKEPDSTENNYFGLLTVFSDKTPIMSVPVYISSYNLVSENNVA